jgi:hypothetical protein
MVDMKMGFMAAILKLPLFLLFATSAVGQTRAVEKPLDAKDIVYESSGEATTESLAGRRDLSKYADGGHFKFRYFSPKPDERAQDISSLAKFLIDRLDEKQLGYVRATFVGIDAGATYHFFIEPDRDGRWTVRTMAVGWHALSNGSRMIRFPLTYRLEQTKNELKFFGKSGRRIEQLVIK